MHVSQIGSVYKMSKFAKVENVVSNITQAVFVLYVQIGISALHAYCIRTVSDFIYVVVMSLGVI